MRPPPDPVGARIFLVWGISVRPSARRLIITNHISPPGWTKLTLDRQRRHPVQRPWSALRRVRQPDPRRPSVRPAHVDARLAGFLVFWARSFPLLKQADLSMSTSAASNTPRCATYTTLRAALLVFSSFHPTHHSPLPYLGPPPASPPLRRRPHNKTHYFPLHRLS